MNRRGFFGGLLGLLGLATVAKAALAPRVAITIPPEILAQIDEHKRNLIEAKKEIEALQERLRWIEWANKGNIRLPKEFTPREIIIEKAWTQEEEDEFAVACHYASDESPSGCFDMRKLAHEFPNNRCAQHVIIVGIPKAG